MLNLTKQYVKYKFKQSARENIINEVDNFISQNSNCEIDVIELSLSKYLDDHEFEKLLIPFVDNPIPDSIIKQSVLYGLKRLSDDYNCDLMDGLHTAIHDWGKESDYWNLFTKLDHFISELPANYAKTELHKMANDYITSYIKPGSLVMINDSIASVIALSGEKIADDIIPEDHIAIWNGLNSTEVKTIPVEYCLPIVNYQINH